jgi:hypothetical protein
VNAALRKPVHPAERANRAAKVRVIVDAIARDQRGFDGLIAELLVSWTDENWERLGRELNLKSAPGEITREIVIGIFDDRERRVR